MVSPSAGPKATWSALGRNELRLSGLALAVQVLQNRLRRACMRSLFSAYLHFSHCAAPAGSPMQAASRA